MHPEKLENTNTESSSDIPMRLTGLKRIGRAFFFTFNGFKVCFQSEDAFRQECLLAVILVPIALLLPVSALSKAVMLSSLIIVLIVEMLNTAIEKTIDRISLEYHSLSKKIKDMGSAAVFMSCANVVVIWSIILLDHFWVN